MQFNSSIVRLRSYQSYHHDTHDPLQRGVDLLKTWRDIKIEREPAGVEDEDGPACQIGADVQRKVQADLLL